MTATQTLASQIRPRESYLRATNLEAHQGQDDQYIPTGRALEVVRRLVHSIEDPTAGRAWSLTGPYGAGKSSFAVFLRALVGPAGSARNGAEASLEAADGALQRELVAARQMLKADAGFVLATTTCQNEPVANSLLRALELGCKAKWPTKRPAVITDALSAARASKDARAVASAARTIASLAPTLVILDEFGKTLEYFASRTVDDDQVAADLFVLQELAEAGMGHSAAPLFLFTLQHLAFDDYVRQASHQQRREWGKVQGRFEDVSFRESAEQSLRLVAGALDDSPMSAAFAKRRSSWATSAFDATQAAGVSRGLAGGAETVARCYPLHPLALVALPQLCEQLGQHGRTLFSFLASSEAGTARSFLEDTPLPRGGAPLPTIGLSDLFDFFATSGQAMALSVGGSRWREIHERITEAVGVDDADLAILKTVGLLNLVGGPLGLRASADVVSLALSDTIGARDQHWRQQLDNLEARGYLTFRAFADEYRLWQGSDVDLRSRVADAREQLRSTSPADLLRRLQSDTPIIAARHSQEVGMLRYFAVSYSDDGPGALPALADDDPADGLVVYHLGSGDGIDVLHPTSTRRPTVLIASDRAQRVRDAAVEMTAALAVLDQQEVMEDRVARRELQDRVADARNRLTHALAASFRPGSDGFRFRVHDGMRWADSRCGDRSLSRLLSEVCDTAYSQSPHVRNEMLGRRELTSQGAKARRMLIEAMIDGSNLEHLGLKGFGPERAMYDAFLRHTELHVEVEDGWTFAAPAKDSSLADAWTVIAQLITAAADEPVTVARLYHDLEAPPIGLKQGPIPVLLVAFLLQRRDEVAIYEDGTFQPGLSADMIERLVKAPAKFALKSFAHGSSKARVLSAIGTVSAELGVAGLRPDAQASVRNQSVLSVAAPLLNMVRGLNDYTRKTSRVSPHAAAVREALLTAREPDRLLLVELPTACGISEAAWRKPSAASMAQFSDVLSSALCELQDAYQAQLMEIQQQLAELFHETADLGQLRRSLAARGEQIDDKVIDPRLKTLIFNLSDGSTDDQGWLGRIGLAVTSKSVDRWADDDRHAFARGLNEVAAAFQRVEALHADLRTRSFQEGFSARRLTMTTPEGDEQVRVLYFDHATAGALEDVVAQALREAERAAGGPHGRDAIAALLVERVLSGQQSIASNTDESVGELHQTKRKSHGI